MPTPNTPARWVTLIVASMVTVAAFTTGIWLIANDNPAEPEAAPSPAVTRVTPSPRLLPTAPPATPTPSPAAEAEPEKPATPSPGTGQRQPSQQQRQESQEPTVRACPTAGLVGQLLSYTVEPGGIYEYVLTARGAVVNLSGEEIVLGGRDTPNLTGYDKNNQLSLIVLLGDWDRKPKHSNIIILSPGEELGYTVTWEGFDSRLLETRYLNSTPQAGSLLATYNSGELRHCSPLPPAGGGVDVPFAWSPGD